MKHIAFFVVNMLFPGGVQNITTSLANEFVRRGYKVSIISIGYFNEPYYKLDESIDVIHLFHEEINHTILFGGNKFARLKLYASIISRLNKTLKQNKIDELIVPGVEINLFCLPIKFWNKKIKIISWDHLSATIRDNVLMFGRNMAKKYANAIVVLTQRNKEIYQEDGAAKVPIFIIHNFMNMYPEETAPLKSKNVLAVGRHDAQKAFDIMIDVWQKVKQNDKSDGWILNIVGDGPDKETTKNDILRRNLGGSIKLIDATPDVSQYYLGASIYLMTSRFEGLPMVLIEAQSYGLPIVSFDCPTGPREIVDDGKDGFLVPMGDNEDMEQKIIELINNEQLRISMGEKAKENSQRFKKELIVDQWVKMINEL